VKSRARVAKGQPEMVLRESVQAARPSTAGARVSVRHAHAEVGGNKSCASPCQLRALMAVEHEMEMHRELISLRATRADFVFGGQTNFKLRGNCETQKLHLVACGSQFK